MRRAASTSWPGARAPARCRRCSRRCSSVCCATCRPPPRATTGSCSISAPGVEWAVRRMAASVDTRAGAGHRGADQPDRRLCRAQAAGGRPRAGRCPRGGQPGHHPERRRAHLRDPGARLHHLPRAGRPIWPASSGATTMCATRSAARRCCWCATPARPPPRMSSRWRGRSWRNAVERAAPVTGSAFFFEKKKQKTFDCSAVRRISHDIFQS